MFLYWTQRSTQNKAEFPARYVRRCELEWTVRAMTTKTMIFIVGTLVCVSTACAAEDQPDGAPLTAPPDQNPLRITWRNLGSEQVMFPLEMKDMPVQIERERQLFLDNYLVAESQHVTRQVHHPKRYSNNPVLAPPKAELNHVVVQHVLHFDEPPFFRMWYWSRDGWQTLPSGQQIRFATSYATSNDGTHWERPNLDLHTVDGLVGPNNVVVPYGMTQGLFYNPDEPNADKRFQSLVCVERKNPVVREGYYLHTSPDGVHWKGDLSRPVIPSLTGPYSIPQNGIGDTTRFWRDPFRRKYIGDVKFVIYGKQRRHGVMESDDLIHWTRPTLTFLALRDDAEIYGHRGFAYQGMYIGMRWIFLPSYSQRHSSYVELDCSRDSRIWTRVGAGQPFMEFNPRHDSWDASIMRPVSMLNVGDEIWIYYFSAPTELETGNSGDSRPQPTDWSAGLAKLLRDRFVSINAGNKIGTLITRPIDFHGSRLYINATVAQGGELRVGLLAQDGEPIPGYTTADCTPVGGDSIRSSASWQAGHQLTDLDHSQVRLQFQLRNAKLFSFWID